MLVIDDANAHTTTDAAPIYVAARDLNSTHRAVCLATLVTLDAEDDVDDEDDKARRIDAERQVTLALARLTGATAAQALLVTLVESSAPRAPIVDDCLAARQDLLLCARALSLSPASTLTPTTSTTNAMPCPLRATLDVSAHLSTRLSLSKRNCAALLARVCDIDDDSDALALDCVALQDARTGIAMRALSCYDSDSAQRECCAALLGRLLAAVELDHNAPIDVHDATISLGCAAHCCTAQCRRRCAGTSLNASSRLDDDELVHMNNALRQLMSLAPTSSPLLSYCGARGLVLDAACATNFVASVGLRFRLFISQTRLF